MKTEIITSDIEKAVSLIISGALVAVPTETVYGLAADGLNSKAVERIYQVKGRPQVKPISLMVAGPEDIDKYCIQVPEKARKLAEKFWPGPLTIVLKANQIVPEIVRAGGNTVGLRCPRHPITLELLRKCSIPLAVPSANPSGAVSAKNIQQVLEYFEGKIEAVIDGGQCNIGTESTVIDLSGSGLKILRLGALSEEELQ